MAAGYKSIGSFHGDNVDDMVAAAALPTFSEPAAPTADLEPEAIVDAVYPVASRDTGGSLSCGASLGTVSSFGPAFAKHFFLDLDHWVFVNHGAFGGTARCAMEAAQRWRMYAETQPLRFIDRQLFSYVVAALRRVAALLRAPIANVAFTENATYGLNCAIAAAAASCKLGPADTVFMLDIGYGSVKKMAGEACKRSGATLVTHTMTFPISGPADIVAQARRGMEAAASRPGGNGRIALAIFDHVTSNTALVLPVAALTAAAQAFGARVLIDGAHGLGSLDLDVPAIGCDWYVSNAHKWLCSGKGVAVLYAADAVKSDTRPLIISHGHGSGFASEFIWDGNRDYSGILALPALLTWWQRVDASSAREYCRGLLKEAVALLCDRWGTGTHAPVECYSHMACVELPQAALPPGAIAHHESRDSCAPAHAASASGGAGASAADSSVATASPAAAIAQTGTLRFTATSTHAKMVQDRLHFEHRIECPVKHLPTAPATAPASAGAEAHASVATAGGTVTVEPSAAADGAMGMRLYVRISVAPYNCLRDYERLAEAVLGMRWAD